MVVSLDSRWDISVENRDGQLILAVEIKRKFNASSNWAAKLRRNILAHGTFPKALYFLMVFPDQFYLWTKTDAQLDYSEPTYQIDARPILQPYFERAGVTADQISEQSLELIISSWLGQIIYTEKLPENLERTQPWLIESGLHTALAGGRLQHEAVA